jgi:hypothetical protein
LFQLKEGFNLKISKEAKITCAQVAADVKDYVKICGEYFKYKSLEEKAKVSPIIVEYSLGEEEEPCLNAAEEGGNLLSARDGAHFLGCR